MSFTCQCCGDCCSTMGEIIGVHEQIRPFEFRIRYTTGEERIVAVDQDKRELFGTVREGERRYLACPFLRQKAPGKRICTVHASRPDLCRRYLCSRILILYPGGTRAGRVLPASRTFVTTDSILSEIWRKGIRDRCIPDEGDWERHVEVVLTRAGYRVVR